ncbi:MAG: polyribonucleotide nucleotidyltransferase [Bacteroidia bacterium]
MSKPQAIRKEVKMADGQVITLETGLLAKQADGSVVLRCGNCVLLATVVSAKDARDGVDFMPLSVDYLEKFSSAGRFPGGFLKRETRPSDYEVLISRLVDRALRPLFPDDYHSETQMIIQMISSDENVAPDALAGFAASAALAVSDIPFGGPISEVRVARIDGEYKINPPRPSLANADIDLIVSGTIDTLNMVEGEMSEVSEQEMLDAIKLAQEAIKQQCQAQLDFAAEVGATEKREYSHEESDEELAAKIHELFYQKIYDVAAQASDKSERSEKFAAFIDEYIEELGEEPEENLELVKRYYKKTMKKAVRDMVLDTKQRLDGRQLDEVRPIWNEIDYLPSTHGSSVFTRGETQALATVTLGTKMDEQMVDRVLDQGSERFLLHYNFPPFSTGEARFLRSSSRREIGHGNLAMRALKGVLPSAEDCPYTIRVTSEVLESNGSSSMATVCSGSMALMDAGVQVKSGVSGIAMGMISDPEKGKYAILSDILGDEDHLGDMDFKVAGTKDGITACQMDIKVDGLTFEVLEEALLQAKEGRAHILGEMNKSISEARSDYKDFVPRMHQMLIDKDYIGAVIGKGGEVIQKIQAETGTTISIEEDEEAGKGIVQIAGVNPDNLQKAIDWVTGIITEPEVGETYEGKVVESLGFGVLVEIMPGSKGLLHVSEWAYSKTENIEDEVKVGETVTVKLLDVDKRNGKLKLSRRALLEKPEGWVDRPPRDDRRGGRRDDRRGGGRDDRRGGFRRDDRRDDRRGGGRDSRDRDNRSSDNN